GEPPRPGKAERLDQRVVHRGVDGGAHERPERSREPCQEQVAGRGTDALVRLGEPEVASLVVAIELLELVVRRGDLADVHPPADLAPEVEHRQPVVKSAGATLRKRIRPAGSRDPGIQDAVRANYFSMFRLAPRIRSSQR